MNYKSVIQKRRCFALIIISAIILLSHVSISIPVISSARAGETKVVTGSADEAYRQAWDTYYRQYRVKETQTLLGHFLAREDLSVSKRIKGLQLQANCFIAQDDSRNAQQSLIKILELDNDYRMDVERVPCELWRVYYKLLEQRGCLRQQDGIRTVAVIALTNNSVTEREEMDGLSQGFADALINNLTGATEMRIIERERLDFIRKEIGLQQGAEFSREHAVEAGRLLGAQSLVVGGFCRINEQIRIDLRIVKTETGEILETHAVDGKIDDIFGLIHSLSQECLSDLGAVYQLPPPPEDIEFRAFLEYSKGLILLDQYEDEKALKHFQQALVYSPDNEKAKTRIEQIVPMYAGDSVR